MTPEELNKPRYYYAIDACNHAGCWENLTGGADIRPQDLWSAGYQFHQWYVSLKFNPCCKYTQIRLTVDLNDGKGSRTVLRKELQI